MHNTVKKVLHSSSFNMISGLLLGCAWAVFAWVNIKAYISTGTFAYLLFSISETLQAIFFIIRAQPKTVSTEAFAWAAALGGTFAALSLRPGGMVLWDGGGTLIAVGFSMQIIALLSLNTSFSIVPANRGIKTNFGYSIVRHPIYATYIISISGYLLLNLSLLNIFWAMFFLVLTVIRIYEEEKLLLADKNYQEYVKKVPYRLLPFVF